ncbi:MAG: FMN-binding protein [Planctomycetota bacterium]
MKQRLYNVAFTVVLCAVCAGALTFANTYWGPIYQENLKRDRYAAAIEATGVVEKAPSGAAQVRDLFMGSIRETKTEGVLKVMDGDKLVAWAVEVKGQGLEGPIHAFLGVETDRETVIAFRVYHQEETPGLGSRCKDPEFTGQFPGKKISGPKGPGMLLVTSASGPSASAPSASAPNAFSRIPGATFTSKAVERMLNAGILQFVAGRKLYPLVLELPKKRFALDGEPRPPFMVPEGVTNVARGRKVKVSDDEEPVMGEIAQITDGVKDAAESAFVEVGFGTMWVQLDFETPHEIYCALVWHDHTQKMVYTDVIVQVADDAEFTKNVKTLFNNDRDNSSELGAGADRDVPESYEGILIDAQTKTLEGLAPAVARYIRFYSNGNSVDEMTNRYTEIEVYGKPASEDSGDGDSGGADAGPEGEE